MAICSGAATINAILTTQLPARNSASHERHLQSDGKRLETPPPAPGVCDHARSHFTLVTSLVLSDVLNTQQKLLLQFSLQVSLWS